MCVLGGMPVKCQSDFAELRAGAVVWFPRTANGEPHCSEQTQLEIMKRAIILAALPLACTASTAFVCPAALAANRPIKPGDVSSAIAPHRALKAKNNQQRRRGRQLLEASLGGAGSPAVVGAVVSSASFVLAWSPTAAVAVVGVLLGASVVNALQGGVRGDLGSTPDKILGVPAEEATAEHVAKLGAFDLGAACFFLVRLTAGTYSQPPSRGAGILVAEHEVPAGFSRTSPLLRTAPVAGPRRSAIFGLLRLGVVLCS